MQNESLMCRRFCYVLDFPSWYRCFCYMLLLYSSTSFLAHFREIKFTASVGGVKRAKTNRGYEQQKNWTAASDIYVYRLANTKYILHMELDRLKINEKLSDRFLLLLKIASTITLENIYNFWLNKSFTGYSVNLEVL